MHAVSHSLAQRGALRHGARWHPYVSPRTSGGGSSQTLPHADFPDPNSFSQPINTPYHVPSVSPPSQACGDERTGNPRAKFLVSLLDQAVRTLGEIWQPKFIPAVFTVPVGTTSLASDPPILSRPTLTQRNSQLPSPISPMTQVSPHTQQLVSVDPNAASTGLVPLKGFVHEVLRRSRTSATALQTALCYIEAVRVKVPGLYEQERHGEGVQGEPDLSCRIEIGVEMDDATASLHDTSFEISLPGEDVTGLLQTEVPDSVSLSKKRKTPSVALPPLPPLPTPLLCPRRTFLAALILASKFTQDKCYSNRAWAKLSGLPAREIGRCERALGDALEWRLWVGKAGSQMHAGIGPDIAPTHSLTRCRSEGDLKFSNARPRPVIAYFPSPPTSDAGSPEISRLPAPRALGRSSTAPALAFPPPKVPIGLAATDVVTSFFSNAPSSQPYHSIGNITPLATPNLDSSPSSDGDRTIQVNPASSFLDDIATPINSFPMVHIDTANTVHKAETLSFWPVGYNSIMGGIGFYDGVTLVQGE